MASIDGLIRNGRGLKLIEPAEFPVRHKFLKEHLEEASFSSLVGGMVEQGGVIEAATSEPFDAANAEYYADLLNAGGHAIPAFNSWISDGLKSIEAVDWASALRGETYLIQLMVERYEKGGRYKLGLPFADGVLAYAKELMSGEGKAKGQYIVSQRFLSVIWGDDRSALRRRLLDSAMATDGQIASSFFDVFGSEVSDIDMIRNDQEVVRKLLEPILRRRNSRGLEWLSALLDRHPDLLNDYHPPYDVAQLRARAEEVAGEELEDHMRGPILRIAHRLGLDLPASDVEDPASETKE
jgi:hypothetical protein